MNCKNIYQCSDDRKFHIPSGCGIAGLFNKDGSPVSGEKIFRAINSMKERGNGLGSGYAGYGIYPDYRNDWCFHLLYSQATARDQVEQYFKTFFHVKLSEKIPTRKIKSIKNPPLLWRYFLQTKNSTPAEKEENLIVSVCMWINHNIQDAFVISSGKDMGIFKGVGEPAEIADFYRLEDYKGYLWTGHNRFPTNSVGWWGGAHPFGLLDWSVVHNGEISSYGVNRRYLENFGYYCCLFTDTEVITYLFDLLVRKHNLSLDTIGNIISAPFWIQIDNYSEQERYLLKWLRIIYGPALVNGPFSIIVARGNFMLGINDRIKLRPLVAAEKGNSFFLASEESAIVSMEKNPDNIWTPEAGAMTVGFFEKGNHGNSKNRT
ncbi:MAG TPA: glutamine amidotransferase family protein [bacterium]|nr:glutamine amidotransferase family protein [bacterium]HOL49510.1 glutamine amidotransferase family protein [bacterium]HPO51677.1 glutamine amidotransferase family protein [bacterium]HXK44666.1 glutamine amidotransferase family protein [bacterium]